MGENMAAMNTGPRSPSGRLLCALAALFYMWLCLTTLAAPPPQVSDLQLQLRHVHHSAIKSPIPTPIPVVREHFHREVHRDRLLLTLTGLPYLLLLIVSCLGPRTARFGYAALLLTSALITLPGLGVAHLRPLLIVPLVLVIGVIGHSLGQERAASILQFMLKTTPILYLVVLGSLGSTSGYQPEYASALQFLMTPFLLPMIPHRAAPAR